ncbi:MAG TPA: cob(I)yrinic acid a,c-diamide adenosyltransferase [Eggerthellaceae bacterium]|nr:cob(I)yrinic acid a,c-diamide adenosyltransferase [Eggerthellaceae bacterium]
MRFYTRTGDKGETSLYSGERVPKNAARVEAYGTVDELQACVGFARSLVQDADMNADLLAVEGVLGGVMAQLATIGERTWIVAEDVANIEALCDKYTDFLAAIGWKPDFVLPGESPASSALHMARTTARRSERRILTLAETDPVDPLLLQYVNRTSDLFYVMAVYVDKR